MIWQKLVGGYEVSKRVLLRLKRRWTGWIFRKRSPTSELGSGLDAGAGVDKMFHVKHIHLTAPAEPGRQLRRRNVYLKALRDRNRHYLRVG